MQSRNLNLQNGNQDRIWRPPPSLVHRSTLCWTSISQYGEFQEKTRSILLGNASRSLGSGIRRPWRHTEILDAKSRSYLGLLYAVPFSWMDDLCSSATIRPLLASSPCQQHSASTAMNIDNDLVDSSFPDPPDFDCRLVRHFFGVFFLPLILFSKF